MKAFSAFLRALRLLGPLLRCPYFFMFFFCCRLLATLVSFTSKGKHYVRSR